MSRLTPGQRIFLGIGVLSIGLAACGPLVVEPVADSAPVDKDPAALVEGAAETDEAKAQSGEIPLQPAVITGSLVIEPAQAYSDARPDLEATNTPEPYVPYNYSEYAQARGLDVPSNLSREVDTQFRAFYNYIFNQQFEITNADGTVTTGSLLSASNAEINIYIAPDGTPYVSGVALDNDPAFGGGDHHFVMIWDKGADSITSLKISKLIGVPSIEDYGNYTAKSAEGTMYRYNSETNAWEANSPAAPTLAPIALPTEMPVPTSTVVPTSIFTVTPPPTSTIAAPSATRPASTIAAASATPPASRGELQGFIEVDYGVPGVEGPVFARLIEQFTVPNAETMLNQMFEGTDAVHDIGVDYQDGFTIVSVYPSFIERVDIFQAKTTIDGDVYETTYADVGIVYLGAQGVPKHAVVRFWPGFSTTTRGHDLFELSSFLGRAVTIATAGDLPVDSTGSAAFANGETRANTPSKDVYQQFLTGGEITGYTYNIRGYKP
jgi:hypothetical protein